MFVSDGLKSLETAVAKVFNSWVHQKCIVYLQRNLLAKVRSAHKQEIADDFKKVLNPDKAAHTKEIAMKELKIFAKK